MEKTIEFEARFVGDQRKALQELFDGGGPRTIYGTDANGDLHPIMNITKHPDCPEGWFEAVINYLIQF